MTHLILKSTSLHASASFALLNIKIRHYTKVGTGFISQTSSVFWRSIQRVKIRPFPLIWGIAVNVCRPNSCVVIVVNGTLKLESVVLLLCSQMPIGYTVDDLFLFCIRPISPPKLTVHPDDTITSVEVRRRSNRHTSWSYNFQSGDNNISPNFCINHNDYSWVHR